jgi:cyclase
MVLQMNVAIVCGLFEMTFLRSLMAVLLFKGTLLFAQQAAVGARGPGFGSPGPPPKLTKIRENIYLLQNQANTMSDLVAYGGNLTIYLTDSGLILVDSKSQPIHSDVVSKIKSISDKPIKYLVLTHNHGDHSGGAASFESEGAQVVISTNDRNNMAKAANQTWLPSFTYAGSATIFLGGKEVRLQEMRGHTRGDTVVYFPAERVICAGDLVTFPWADIPLIINYGDGGNWTDWDYSIQKLLGMEWEVLIPGHGPPINKQQLAESHDRMLQIMDRVRTLNRERKTPDEITRTLIQEFNWGSGPAAGVIPGMITELR